jgi:hypothetical protein
VVPRLANRTRHCQRATAEYRHRRGADFILPAKDNQPGLFDALDALPWRDVPVACAATSRGQGREDNSTVRTKSGPRAMATLRNLAVGALHLAGRHDTTEATRWASRNMDRPFTISRTHIMISNGRGPGVV